MTILPARTMAQRVEIVERLRGRVLIAGQPATIVNLDNDIAATVRGKGDCPFMTDVSWGWLAQMAAHDGCIDVADGWTIIRQ